MIESVKCTTTSYVGLACCRWQRVVGEYSIPEFLKAKEDVPQRAVVCEELDLARTIE
jgi:hypothetical protein